MSLSVLLILAGLYLRRKYKEGAWRLFGTAVTLAGIGYLVYFIARP